MTFNWFQVGKKWLVLKDTFDLYFTTFNREKPSLRFSIKTLSIRIIESSQSLTTAASVNSPTATIYVKRSKSIWRAQNKAISTDYRNDCICRHWLQYRSAPRYPIFEQLPRATVTITQQLFGLILIALGREIERSWIFFIYYFDDHIFSSQFRSPFDAIRVRLLRRYFCHFSLFREFNIAL